MTNILTHISTRWCKTILMPVFLMGTLLMVEGCGPPQQDEWSSYYYGTGRRSVGGVYYDRGQYPADNDDAYVMPQGYWEDNQIPQGQRW